MGKIVEVALYSRQLIRNNPGALYVFGDNMTRTGLGGQAKECRGEPNAVGIPTKWAPTTGPEAYFDDGDLPVVEEAILDGFRKLASHLRNGGDVVWPRDGLGTGLAQIPRRAPLIHRFIERCKRRLDEIARVSLDTKQEG